MTIKIPACTISKAAKGNRPAIKWLIEQSAKSQKDASIKYEQEPCNCKPRCQKPTMQQFVQLNDRVWVGVQKLDKIYGY